MKFEVFERKSRPTVTIPVVGVQTRGTMSLNAPAFNLLASTAKSAKPSPKQSPKTDVRQEGRRKKQTAKVGDADALVEFLYDRESRVVGLRLASPNSLNSYPVRRQPVAESYLVTAKAFLVYHQIPTDKLRRYTAHLFEGGVLGFSLVSDEMK
jgi:hypothetical protein